MILSIDQFTYRESCPACHCHRRRVLSHKTAFRLAEPFPGGTVQLGPDVTQVRKLYECGECTLWYYDYIPSPSLITALLDRPELADRWRTDDRLTFKRARSMITTYLSGSANVLDIGAHYGGFLDMLPQGWKKFALEPMATSASSIKDTIVLHGFLEETELPEATLDCISAFDVFEHLYDPDKAMDHIARALKPGGIAVIETGTSDAQAARYLRAAWYYLSLVEHFQVFNHQSLSLLCARHGLVVRASERVYHTKISFRRKLWVFVYTVLYILITRSGTDAQWWRKISQVLRPTSLSQPPISLGLEKDHLFMVVQLPDPV